MPPAPKRAYTIRITDFAPAEQRLLRAAFHAFVPFVLVGGLEEVKPRVLSLGHPDGLAKVADYPPGARVFAMIRIRGVDQAPDEVRLPVAVKAARK